jgi:hypothetical protein
MIENRGVCEFTNPSIHPSLKRSILHHPTQLNPIELTHPFPLGPDGGCPRQCPPPPTARPFPVAAAAAFGQRRMGSGR